nr:hypothetical protein [Tanacetum cinerariifolium]
MSTMAENVIVAGADNHPPMLKKRLYNSWQSHMKLYIRGKENGKDLLNSNVYGRQTQGYTCSGARGNATGTRVNINAGTNTTNQAKVVRCYNFKEKMLLAQDLEVRVVLDEEQMAFLVDDGERIATGQDTYTLTTTTIFQTDDLDAFDLDSDKAPSDFDAPEIYMLQFWHIVTYDLTAKTYFFTIDDRIFEVIVDLLREALQITHKDYDHPFIKPPYQKEIFSFIKKLGYSGSLTRISGAKEPIYGMPIRMVMLSNEIKASADYLEYLEKSEGEKPVKASKDDFILQQHPKSSSEGSGVTREVLDGLSHKRTYKGSDISSDEERFEEDDIKKADVKKDRADKEKAREEQNEKTTQPPQPSQPPQSIRKTKVLLKKSKKPEAQADTDVILKRLMKLETKDPPTNADKESKKRKRKDYNEMASKKSKDKDASSKEGKAPSKSSKSDKVVDVEETVKDGAMDGEKVNNDIFVDTQYDAAPTQDRSKWFKQDVVAGPKTPDLKWHKEPNANDAPDQN